MYEAGGNVHTHLWTLSNGDISRLSNNIVEFLCARLPMTNVDKTGVNIRRSNA